MGMGTKFLIGAGFFIIFLAIWAVHSYNENIVRGVIEPIINKDNPENYTNK